MNPAPPVIIGLYTRFSLYFPNKFAMFTIKSAWGINENQPLERSSSFFTYVIPIAGAAPFNCIPSNPNCTPNHGVTHFPAEIVNPGAMRFPKSNLLSFCPK